MDDKLENVDKIYGCFGVKSVEGVRSFFDMWAMNNGDSDVLSGVVTIVDLRTRAVYMWDANIFNGRVR